MAWDLDDLENDDDYCEMPADVREHLHSCGADGEFQDAGDSSPWAASSLIGDASPRQTPIVFLNVDGVLHPREALHDDCFGTQQMQQLRRIIHASHARIVLSSTWRLDGCSLERVATALKGVGIDSLIGATPNLEKEGQQQGLDLDTIRASEIQAWLEDHDGLVDPESWAVIDASHVDTEDGDGVNHTVTTDPTIGLTFDVASMVLEKLGSPSGSSEEGTGADIRMVGLPNE